MSSITKSALIAAFTSDSDSAAEAAALQLASDGSWNSAVVRDLLAHPNSDVRWWTTRSLAEVREPQAAVLLSQSLDDPQISVRQCAAIALRYNPAPDAAPNLILALNDPDRLMARLAGDALIALDEAAVPALIEVMETGSPSARLEAARALAAIGDTRAIPILFRALDQDSTLVEYWAEKGLQNMGVEMVFFKS
jgi:HEAT repeat protein